VTAPDFYKRAFWALVVFALGNGTSFLAFGLNRVTKTDFTAATRAIETRLDKHDDHLSLIDENISDLRGQLKGEKLLGPTP
jgi:hypothetical protein